MSHRSTINASSWIQLWGNNQRQELRSSRTPSPNEVNSSREPSGLEAHVIGPITRLVRRGANQLPPRQRLHKTKLILVALACVTAVAVLNLRDDTQTVEATSLAELTTVTVQRGSLRRTADYQGHLTFGQQRPMKSSRAGTITWTPQPGTSVSSGEIIWRIDQKPTFFIHGTVPMFRNLVKGVTGDDVRQLEAFLIKEGFGVDGWEADEYFTNRTRQAVKRFEEHHGIKVDGSLQLADVVFGPESLNIAEVANIGDMAQDAAIVTTTSTQPSVIVTASNRQVQNIEGEPTASIKLQDDEIVGGRLASISMKTTEDGSTNHEVRYQLLSPVDVEQPVTVTVDQLIASDELIIPVDALIALVEGGYAVEVATNADVTLRAVDVLGFSQTSVAVQGDLRPGDEVVIPGE